ncbi:hypothetical protein P8S55_09060 [Halomonas sp. M1]|uniref:hypothetical protein n=1 Tax=Halomonas sp. M1 TaxID=3035470 RepID=UPI002486494D|nr:hypothetical protein [Halomonas sp. M1]WFE69941.1 hypothetical protein P8S55_09060 [Halomonas sp. M1]
MAEEDKSSILSYWNMVEFDKDKQVSQVSEFPLFSDSHITGEVNDEVGPYQFLNLVPSLNEAGVINESIMLRVAWFIDGRGTYEVKTDFSKYHGGWATDEIAALASLRLGIRLKAGEQTRLFGGYSSDPLGTPRTSCKKRPEIFFKERAPILPGVVKTVSMNSLKDIQGLKKVTPSQYAALVRAARQYQDAIWIAESEPELAWLMLVSAIETAANEWSAQDLSPIEKMKKSKPDLSDLIVSRGGEELLEVIAKDFAPTLGATNKFIKFCLGFFPDPPAIRPCEHARVKWSKTGFKSIINVVYKYRSIALHAGIPFPAPLCSPPEKTSAAEGLSEKGCLFLAVHTLGASWKSDDLPISMNTFSYFVNGVLNNWWNKIVQEGSQ